MPPRKKQKTQLEQDLAVFLDHANQEFSKAKRADKEYITLFKFRQIVKKFDMNLDDRLITEEDHQGLRQDRFIALIEQVKRESDLSCLVDYIYDYLLYDTLSTPDTDAQVDFESFMKALRTLPKTPKRFKTIEQGYCFANNASVSDPLTKDDLLVVMRQLGFFQTHYQDYNVNSSFNSQGREIK